MWQILHGDANRWICIDRPGGWCGCVRLVFTRQRSPAFFDKHDISIRAAFERASGRKIPYQIVARRPGDVALTYADPAKANQELGWRAVRGLDETCADVWRWQAGNPNGYE